MHPREQAALKGEKTYTGKPCKNCGNARRYTLSSSCIYCTTELAKINVKKRREHIKHLMSNAKAGA